MVLTRNFSIQLVNAASKIPFKEHHGSDNKKVYAQVEPGQEYYIEVQVMGTVDTHKTFLIDYAVDGTKLGYKTSLCEAHGKYYAGIASRSNGYSTMRALSAQRPPVTLHDDGSNTANKPILEGTVTVEITEGIQNGSHWYGCGHYMGRVVTPSSVSTASILAASNNGSLSTEVLRSGQGTHAEMKHLNGEYPTYMAGNAIEKITIHYCTSLGLMQAGIISQTPSTTGAHPANLNSDNSPWFQSAAGQLASAPTLVAANNKATTANVPHHQWQDTILPEQNGSVHLAANPTNLTSMPPFKPYDGIWNNAASGMMNYAWQGQEQNYPPVLAQNASSSNNPSIDPPAYHIIKEENSSNAPGINHFKQENTA